MRTRSGGLGLAKEETGLAAQGETRVRNQPGQKRAWAKEARDTREGDKTRNAGDSRNLGATRG
jgi:hypothetical protein